MNSTSENLQGLVTTLELQNANKKDMIVPAGRIGITKSGIMTVMDGFSTMQFSPTDICHEQIANKLKIPVQYYRRMLAEYPELLSKNVNGWLKQDSNKSKYMVRTFDAGDGVGTARAFLSDSYHILDNHDVLFAALEAIKSSGIHVEITKAVVSDRRMYLHVVCPEVEIQADAFLREYLKSNDAAGNGIISGFVLANSEVGHGKFEISPRAVICKCNNGLVMTDEKFARQHLGGKMDEGFINYSDRTKQKNYELIISQTTDAVNTFLSKEYLGKMITRIADAKEIKLENPIDVIHNVCRELSINEDHKKSILNFFIEDGDTRASGIFGAVTRQAQLMPADDQYDVEAGIVSILPRIATFDKPFSKN